MDIKLKLQLISQAQKLLIDNPQDPMHGITHHYRVVQLAKQIVKAEQLQLDENLLEVACWWHDVHVPEAEQKDGERIVAATARFLQNLLPEELQKVGYDAVANHEFGSTPETLEGKVLQDADKLELLSEPRVDETVDNILAGNLDKQKMLRTLEDLKRDWFPRMLDRYNFKFSKEYHQQKFPGFLGYLEGARLKIENPIVVGD